MANHILRYGLHTYSLIFVVLISTTERDGMHLWQTPIRNFAVVAPICDPAILVAEFWDGMGFVSVGGNNLSLSAWIVSPHVIQKKGRDLTKYWELTEASKTNHYSKLH